MEIKKILILGAKGMLGNAVHTKLKQNSNFKVTGTSRLSEDGYVLFDVTNNYINEIERLLEQGEYDCILNCIGFIRPNINDIEDYKKSLLINSHFPKTLQILSYKYGFKLIHFSTDCVFNGVNGNYKETDIPDEFGIYGASKYFGEIIDDNNLTIRTSILGIEKGNNSRNLINWFLNRNEGEILNGFSNVLWNGVTTLTVARIIDRILTSNIDIHGLLQIGGETISKFDLLKLFKEIFEKNVIINDEPKIISNKIVLPSEGQIIFEDLILPLKSQLIDLKEFYGL